MSASESPAPVATRPVPFSWCLPFWRPETGIFLGLWVFLMVVGRSQLFQDPGTFWHRVVGERMVSSGQLIYTDPFTFTWHGHHWIGHQWLGECLMALIHRWDELDSLLLATVTILAGLYTWVAYRFMRTGLHWSLAVVIVVLVVAASASHFHVRPRIGTIVFLGITMGYLVDFEAGRIGLRRLFWLVPIYLVWSSIHGGMVGGLGTMGLALAGWACYWMLGRDSPISSPTSFAAFLGLILLCAATSVINPYGIWLPRTWYAIMESPTLRNIIVEHWSVTRIIEVHGLFSLKRPDVWMIVLLAVIYLAALLSTLPRWPRVTWLLPFVWLYLAYSRIRHGPLFAITAAVALADLLRYSRVTAWLARTGSDLFQPPASDAPVKTFDWRPALLPVLVVAATLILQRAQIEVPIVGHQWVRLEPAYWPVELLNPLQEHQYDQPDGTPIFNEYIYGGFLIYHTPGYRVFVDDRCELYRSPDDQYPDEWLDKFVNAEKTGTAAAIRQWEKSYGRFMFALVKTRQDGGEPGFDDYFRHSPEWAVIQRTPTATFYQRKEPTRAQ